MTPTSRRGVDPATRRSLFLATSIIGNNAPDLDLLYSYRGPAGDPVSYLLGHRGYTHTILGCVALALLLYAGVEAWMYWRRLKPSRVDRLALAGVALLGTGLHLGMDFLNSYGVHPFWPVENRWYYGDSVYIVEPLYWAATAPLLFWLRSTTARVLLGLVLSMAVVLSMASGLVAPLACGTLLVLILVLLFVGWRAGPRIASLTAAVAFLSVTAGFVLAGQLAARRVETAVHAEFPAYRLIDHVLTPMPADPLCWDVLALEMDGDGYVARHTVLTLAPSVIPAAQCGRALLDRATLVPHTRPPISDPDALPWRVFSMSRANLIALAEAHCNAAALMRFARAPFAILLHGGWIEGDLRFDRSPKVGFSDIRIAADAAPERQCPASAPWAAPRGGDLLEQTVSPP